MFFKSSILICGNLYGLWLVNGIIDYVSDSLLFVERYGINYRTS